MREPKPDNDAGRMLVAIVLTGGTEAIVGLALLMNPPPRVQALDPWGWERSFRAWRDRQAGEVAYCARLLADLVGGGYVTGDARPVATNKGRELVAGWV
jgi:hypothetical protein